ncbi:hypothetical protein [Wenyingzhuangia sp. 2_MG-2023]|uniref:hypothetical protein n=1 Tax=Wenyingzhuangia sp. 2_MG-2023 TaxID=3062639 RepID=UPI0026E1A159|nr:hypothetical protein [Wenyingzhuangia sp. 2_MG-2023]MDO6736828.1 hypothetical protein [Wenyingzhuangia sp. 2_MG-2023]
MIEGKPTKVSSIKNLQFVDNKISFNNKNEFLKEIESIKLLTPEKYYNQYVKPNIQSGFIPLKPYFENDDERLKYLEKFYLNNEDEIVFEETIILDPNFQVLLNKNRELIIDNKLYRYTSEGVYIQPIVDHNNSRKSLIKEAKNNVTFIKLNLQNNIISDYSQIGEIKNETKHPLTSMRTSNDSEMTFENSSNLDYDEERRNSLWEKKIGINHTTYVYTPNNRRVKIKYWDNNYLLFNSTGMEVRFQKKRKVWRWTFWEKSYPSKVQLGINNMSLIRKKPSIYNFNNDWSNDTYQFEYYNRYYDSYGKEVSKERIYSFPLNTANVDIPNNIININLKVPLFNEIHLDYTKIDLYKSINNLAQQQLKNGIKQLSNVLKNTSEPAFKIRNQDSWNQLYTIGNIKHIKSGDNSIKKYIDLGFMIGYSHTLGGNFSFSNFSFSNYKTIQEIKSFDIYGAALYNGRWYGKRIIGSN